MLPLIADVVVGGVPNLLIYLIIAVACAAVFYVFLKQSGLAIPPYIVQILWIVVAAVIAILAIRFLLSL